MNFKTRSAVVATIGAFMLALSAVPSQAIVYEVTDGSAHFFVGKGDVQSAFGWDAKKSDANFDKVAFRYEDVTVETIDCVDGNGQSAEVVGTVFTTDSTFRSTAFTVRQTKVTVTGAWVTKVGNTNVKGAKPECAEGKLQQSSARSVSTEKLIATISETIKGKTNVTEAVIWTKVTNKA
jgi:hypothetical protein